MRVYLINLDRSPERLHFFEKQAAVSGIEFERISAFDGRQLSSEELAAAVAQEFEFQPIGACDIGVLMSHKRAWEKLVASGRPQAAVFEDDAVLSPSIRLVLDAIDASKLDFDIIKLESTLRPVVCARQTETLISGIALQRLHTWHGGAAGYVISAGGARQLLKLNEKVADIIDQVMFNPLSSVSSQLSIFQINPAVCIQKGILEKEVPNAFLSTREYDANRGLVFRHGPLIDTNRLIKKLAEYLRRKWLARRPENIQAVIPFELSEPMRRAS